MNLQSAQYYPTKDIFDVASVDLFTGRTAREHWNYLNSLPPADPATAAYRDSLRQGLVHAARLLLLPRLAFQEGRTAWKDALDYDGIRMELLTSQEYLREAGEVGKPILEQLDKVSRRIDRNEDGALDNSEIAVFLAAKTKFLL